MTESLITSNFAISSNRWGSILPIINLTLMVLFLSTCAPTIPVPSFVGSLIVESEGNIYQLTSDSATKNVNDLRIAGPDVHYAAISADKRQLIYSIGGETRLRDLQTGEVNILFPKASACISWNEAHDMVNYIQGYELFVYSPLTNQSTLVAAAPSALYSYTPLGLPSIADQEVHGTVECGPWIGPDRFLFARTTTMPSQIMDGVSTIQADTLSLAIIGETVTLVNSNSMGLMGISDDGEQILLVENEQLYLTPPFNEFESIVRRRVLVDSRSFVSYSWGFMPSGNELYYAEGGNQIHFIDLKTLEDRLGPKLLANWPY